MITAPVKELAFGDICGQGLAFYGGTLGRWSGKSHGRIFSGL